MFARVLGYKSRVFVKFGMGWVWGLRYKCIVFSFYIFFFLWLSLDVFCVSFVVEERFLGWLVFEFCL